MKMVIFITFLTLILGCSPQNPTPVDELNSPQLIDKENLDFLRVVGSTLNSAPADKNDMLEFYKLESKINKLIQNSVKTAGVLFEVENVRQELFIFKKYFPNSNYIESISRLESDLNKFISGELIKAKNSTTSNPFEINFQIDQSSSDLKNINEIISKNTKFTDLKASWFKEDTEYTCTGISVVNPDPNGPSLTATDYLTERNSDIVTLANSFVNEEDVFKYVRDEIKFWPAFGATQSAKQILKSKLGTFIDKTTLLVSLLRARGIPSQFIFGDVLVPEEKLKGMFGVEGSYDLLWALAYQLIDYWSKPGKGTVFFKNGVKTWLVPHAWVRAYLNGQWLELDPSNIYQEYETQDVVFRRFDLDIDFEKYLVGQNRRGQYEKPGTIVDFVLETASDQIRNEFGSGIGIRDLDLSKFGRTITPEVLGLPTGTMSFDGSGCPFYQEDLIPTQFIQKYTLKMKKAGNEVFSGEWNLPEVAEKGISTRHDAGLLGRVGDQSGNMKIYLGKTEVGSVSSRTTDVINLDYKLDYYPSEYSTKKVLGDTKYSIQSAGDVYAFIAYNIPVAKENLQEEIAILKKYIEENQVESIRYAQFLRVANILTILQEAENHNVTNVINTTGGNLRGVFYTYGKGGIIRDRDDRPYGQIPLGTGISWQGGGNSYSRTGNFSNFSEYTNITNKNLMSIIYGSQIEANIWEILYGVPGGSSTKLMQLMASDIFEGGKENIIVSNQQLGAGRDAEIFAMFNDDMIDSVITAATNPSQGYIKYKSILYSHKSKYHKDNGYTGLSILILPTDPRAGSVANYSGSAPPLGGVGPSGGGTTGEEEDAMDWDLFGFDPNDSELSGVGCSDNPVVFSTGDMFHEFTDFSVPGRTSGSSLKFERKYSTKTFKALGDIGPDWTHNFQTRLISENFDVLRTDLQTNIIWIKEGGNKVLFTRRIDGSYSAPSGIKDVLFEFADHFEIRRKGGNFYSYAKNNSSIPDGRLDFFEEVHGERVTLNYDSNGRLLTASSPFAGSVTFSYDAQNKISTIHRDRDNLTYNFTYNSDGRLASSSDFASNTTTYNYVTNRPGTKAQGLLTSFTDPLNRSVSFEYYDDGRVFQEIGLGGAKVTYFYAYFLADHLTRVIAENGATKLYKFDDQFRLIETEYDDGSRIKQDWDADSNMVSSIDELGYETLFTYDSRGNRTGVKAPEHSGYITTEFDPVFEKPTKVTPLLGAVTINNFDPMTGDLLSTSKNDSMGSVYLNLTYDQFGKPLSKTSNLATYSDVRDSNGFLIQKYDARNPYTQEYDSRGRVIKQTYANGKISTLEYDEFDRVLRVNNNNGPDVVNEYDIMGRLLSRTITDGVTDKKTTYEYDERDRIVATVDPLGRRSTRKYDLPGLGCKYVIDQPLEVKDPQGRTSKSAFDSRNRLIHQVAPDGTITRYEYNERGDLTGITDGSGNRSVFRYDGNRRLIYRERPTTKSASNGDSISAKEITTFDFDEADRMIREKTLLPDETNGTETAKLVTEYEYNELGQTIKKTIKKEFMGQIDVLDESTYSYLRTLDHPSQLTANNQTANLSFSYEESPPFAMTSYSVNSTDPSNPLGLITGSFETIPAIDGQMKSLSIGESLPLIENTYDSESRLTKKTSRYLGNRLITDLSYNSFGQKSQIAHDNGLTGTMTYDVLNRVKRITYTGAGENFDEIMNYDPLSGNITKIDRELGTFDFTHDDKDQLISATYTGSAFASALYNRSLTFDRAGNRTNDNFSGNANFSRNVITEDARFHYYTDPNGLGNIVQKTDKTSGAIDLFEYLTDGKIRKFTKYELLPDATETLKVEYYFDALGRRVAKKITTPSESYTQSYSYLANQDKILLAKDGEGKLSLMVDGQGIDEHYAIINQAAVKTFVSDHLGTVINAEVTNEHKVTGVYGEVLGAKPKMSKSQNPVLYAYTGRQYDSESGLYYYRARSYDANSGRFMSKDPKGVSSGDLNLYRYVGNDPILYTDPSGQQEYNSILAATIQASYDRGEPQAITATVTPVVIGVAAASIAPFAVASAIQGGVILSTQAIIASSNPENIITATNAGVGFLEGLLGPGSIPNVPRGSNPIVNEAVRRGSREFGKQVGELCGLR